MSKYFGLFFLLSLSACDSTPKSPWTLWIYIRGEMLVDRKIGNFVNYEECRNAASNIIKAYPTNPQSTFECGYKCKSTQGGNVGAEPINICKETRDD